MEERVLVIEQPPNLFGKHGVIELLKNFDQKILVGAAG